MFYFAYGSNTQEQLEERLGHPVDHLGLAELPGYRLIYMGRSVKWRSATATALPLTLEEIGHVYGVLYAGLSEEDYQKLDRFEGVKLDGSGQHVGRYRPVEEQVLVDGEYHFARFYVMTGHLNVDREVRPPAGLTCSVSSKRHWLTACRASTSSRPS